MLGYSLLSEFDGADTGPALPLAVAPTADPGLAASSVDAIDQPLRWRDYVIGYEGRLRWDGRSALAALTLHAVDSGNGRVVAEGVFTPAMVVDAPGRIVFALQVPVSGDTRTAGAHTHAVHLVFEQQAGGAWQFRRNCMAPGRPDLCFEGAGAGATN